MTSLHKNIIHVLFMPLLLYTFIPSWFSKHSNAHEHTHTQKRDRRRAIDNADR